VRVNDLSLRDFRSYEQVDVALGPGLTVLAGPNGAGKTNLLEGLYFGCTGRSCRTTNERELVRFGAGTARAKVGFSAPDGVHETWVAFQPGQPKRLKVDGAAVERLVDAPVRPLVSVFLPDRLELVKGPPALRRAHLDQVVTALRPARGLTRRAYAQALAQRNALIARIRSGAGSRESLETWDLQLAGHAMALMADRDRAVAALADPFEQMGAQLGLDDRLSIAYRPRSRAADAAELAAELAARVEQDLERGFTCHGPHRDELSLGLGGRELRVYGSQGQQRLGLLALLLAEREAIASSRQNPPMMLLDDVMSELDRSRRHALIEVLRGGGQTLLSTTDFEHVPGVEEDDVARLAVADGQVLLETLA
jgi:DNA replication and repair protein RecF